MATAVEAFTNDATGTVSSGGTTAPAAGTTETWTVTAAVAFPAASATGTPVVFHVADTAAGSAEQEKILVTACPGGTGSQTWTVTRGAEGTTPAAHQPGFTVEQVVTAGTLNGFQHQGARCVYIDDYGADPTGASDSAAAFNSAVAALPTTGGNPYGVVVFSVGTYKIQAATSNPGPYVTIRGQGRYATYVNKYGTGDTFRMWAPAYTISFPFQTGFAGGIKAMTIDGSNASAGACGLHYGDLNDGQIDVAIQHFNLAGSAGLKFDNTVNWTEKTHCKARLWDNTVNVLFTVSDGSTQAGVTLASASAGNAVFTIASGSWPSDFTAGVLIYGSAGLTTPSSGSQSTLTVASVSGTTLNCTYTGTAPSGTTGSLTQCNAHNSFSYNDFEFDIAATLGYSTAGPKNSGQMGVQFTNGAVPVGGRLVIRGNFQCSNSTQFDTGVFPSGPAVFNLDGAMPANHPNQGATFIEASNLQFQAEGDPFGAAFQPATILLTGSAASSGANGVTGCWGGLYFNGLAAAVLGSNPHFSFAGPIMGDTTLNPANQSNYDNGRPVIAGGTPYLAVTGLDGNSNSQNRLIGGTATGPPTAGAHLAGDISVDQAGQVWQCTSSGTPGSFTALVPLDSDAPAAGTYTMPILGANNLGISLTSGTAYFTYFSAPRRESVTQVIFPSGNTAAGATPTTVLWGLYTVDGSGNLTRVAVTSNDTTLFASSFTKYSKAFTGAYTMIAGQRYALGLLVVSGAAMPTTVGNSATQDMLWDGPVRKMASLTGQSSMPSSVAAGSLAWGTSAPMFAYVSP